MEDPRAGCKPIGPIAAVRGTRASRWRLVCSSRAGEQSARPQSDGHHLTIHGQCDVVVSEATDQLGIIAYAKTGRLRGKDCARVHTYMAMVPLASALGGGGATGQPPASWSLTVESGFRFRQRKLARHSHSTRRTVADYGRPRAWSLAIRRRMTVLLTCRDLPACCHRLTR